jgi:hypothetical protein
MPVKPGKMCTLSYQTLHLLVESSKGFRRGTYVHVPIYLQCYTYFLSGLGYFMGEIVSRTEVAFCFYARSRVPITISLSEYLQTYNSGPGS